jgi:ABC-type polysaccharide/polyol phosphate export permease
MRDFPATPIEMVASIWRNRSLIHAFAKREVLGRYRGSALGLLWSFFNPLLMLTVYTFVFSVVFNARWGGGSSSKVEFALVLFAGLIVFNLFAECIGRAPSLIISNPNYVKKVVFPLEILPFVALLAASYHALLSLVCKGSIRLLRPWPENLTRTQELMLKYPTMDAGDASIVVLSEQYPKAQIITTDSTDFSIYRRFRSQKIPAIFPSS